jgi:predicted DNA-binding transcriptional regulator AlpA
MTQADLIQPAALVTVAEGCRQLRISKAKFYELINSGEIASVVLPSPGGSRAPRRIGEKGPKPARRIEQAEIDAFIERHRVQAPAAP